VLLPLDKAAMDALQHVDAPGLLQRIGQRFGADGPTPSILSQLRSGAVAAAPVVGQGRLRTDGGIERIIDLRPLGAAALGLAPGDRVAGLVPAGPAGGFALEVLRGVGPVRTVEVPVPKRGVAFSFIMEDVPYRLHSPGEAFVLVGDAAVNMVVRTVQMIPRFFQPPERGGIDATRTLSGPVGIFRALKMKLEHTGFDGFLKFLALVGLNLFVVNLLPLPITDGGQLIFLAIEKATGRPLSVRVRTWLAYGGVALVVGLMAFTVGLDLLRWIGLM
jgi:membrane-associated protease RseP (regulator of RpoE activity)